MLTVKFQTSRCPEKTWIALDCTLRVFMVEKETIEL